MATQAASADDAPPVYADGRFASVDDYILANSVSRRFTQNVAEAQLVLIIPTAVDSDDQISVQINEKQVRIVLQLRGGTQWKLERTIPAILVPECRWKRQDRLLEITFAKQVRDGTWPDDLFALKFQPFEVNAPVGLRSKRLRFVCVSDTHCQADKIAYVPDGDVLIHAGDFTYKGEQREIEQFNKWLGKQPHRYKIVIAGNHDFMFERKPAQARALLTNCIYLEDSAVEIEGVKIYGSPWQPWFHNWAFNLHRGAPLREKWDQIPSDTEILVTHGPPMNHGDKTYEALKVGCEELLQAVQRVKPKVHVFGHIHEGYGVTRSEETVFVNASTCSLRYKPVNPPVVFDY